MTKRLPAWLPYLQSVEKENNQIWKFVYKGGEIITKLDSLQSIMIYGESDIRFDISQLEEIAHKGIPIIIHRRTMAQPIYITGGIRPDADDVITYQVIARRNDAHRKHIARKLLQSKFKSMAWLDISEPELSKDISVEQMRNIEAVHAKRYWQRYFTLLGVKQSRRAGESYSAGLDAASKFLSGIILRWIHYHHLSPFHGYLHDPTTYPALIYDLMEPYRSTFDRIILQEWLRLGIRPNSKVSTIVGTAINVVKEALDEKVYIGLTRQIVTRHELLHGIVLSLRFYLMKEQKTFMIPIESKPNGGRPRKVSFRLYGRQAGKTDFWQQAREAARNL